MKFNQISMQENKRTVDLQRVMLVQQRNICID